MKDAYSFHDNLESLDASYRSMYDTYCRIFGRCGLPYIAVEAESGPIGGDSSHEFMVLTPAGEDSVVLSDSGDYAANLERATAASLPAQTDELLELEEVHTPGFGKVEDVCRFMKTEPGQMIKTLIYDIKALKRIEHKDIEWTGWVVALVRGNHEINEHKLEKVVRASLQDELVLDFELATPESIEELTGAVVGFAGPQGLVDRADKLIVDREVATMRNAATGANKTDYHVKNVNPGRDFPLEGDKVVVDDIRNVTDQDLSPTGSNSPLHIKTAIEVGHVFKLGTKYSDSMNATYLSKDGKPQPLIMGCYGIGLNRIVAAAIESHHDDNGIIWPMSITPFEVLVLALDPRDQTVMQTATQIHDQLAEAGIDVLFDDRDERAGFKFKDADLIGIPLRIIVGKKSLADGVVEFSHRRDDTKQKMPPDQAVQHVIDTVKAELAELHK
jgi:prolyl-tRNA synthetase